MCLSDIIQTRQIKRLSVQWSVGSALNINRNWLIRSLIEHNLSLILYSIIAAAKYLLYFLEYNWDKCLLNDLSLSALNSISWFVKSETYLLIATYYTAEKGACVYLYQPESGELTLLKDGLGNISSLFATEHYFSLYSQDPSTAGEDFTLTTQIHR